MSTQLETSNHLGSETQNRLIGPWFTAAGLTGDRLAAGDDAPALDCSTAGKLLLLADQQMG